MNEIIEANYQIEQERTPEVIITEIKLIERSTSQAILEGCIAIGARLKEAKEKVPHGEWESWCEINLNYKKRWVEQMMQISAEYGDENSPYFKAISKTHTCALLSVSNALRLLRVPENEVENFVEEHPELPDMKVRELEEEIRKLKEKNEEAEDELKSLADSNEDLEDDLDEAEKKLKEAEADIKRLEEELKTANGEEEIKAAEEAQKKAEEALEAAEAKKKEAERKLKDIRAQMKEAEEAKEKEIKERIAGAKETIAFDAKREAQKECQQAIDEAKAQVEKLQRQLAQNNNEQIAIHKVKMKTIQDTYADILANVNTMPDEDRDRLKEGFKKFMLTLANNI